MPGLGRLFTTPSDSDYGQSPDDPDKLPINVHQYGN